MRRRQFLQWTGITLAAAVTGAQASRADLRAGMAHAGLSPPTGAAAFRAARRFADTPFGRIAYVERGAGDAALFLHGAPLNGFQWRGAIDRLSACRRCVAPDFMGLGYSEIPARQSLAADAQTGIRRVPGAKLFFPEEFPDLVAAEARRLWRVG